MAHDIGKCVRTKDVLSNIDVLFENDALIEKPIRQGLADNGFIKESPIQMAAFPYILNGYDAIVQSKSGTGKSIVFVVAALNKLIKVPVTQTQTIILAPTREIAVQITDVVRTVGTYVQNLHVDYFIGGTPVVRPKVTPQVVVGSPGRVKQLIKLKHLSVDAVRMLILDEADKLINGSFLDDITWIYSQLPSMKQMLVVSATYSPENLATLHRYMIDPLLIRPEDATRPLIGVKQLVALIPESKNSNLKCVDEEKKLVQLLSHTPFNQCVVFSNYQLRPEVISENLTTAKFGSVFLSGAQEQGDRLAALNAFKQGQVRILVTTDLAARGIDAANVNLVINLEIPHDAATYLHRMGRAGRYGTRGLVITIVSAESLVKFHSLMAEINLDHDFNVGLVPDNLSGTNNWTQRVEVLLAKTRSKKCGKEDDGDEKDELDDKNGNKKDKLDDKNEGDKDELNGKNEDKEREKELAGKKGAVNEETNGDIVENINVIDSKASKRVEDSHRGVETNSGEKKSVNGEKSVRELKEIEHKMSYVKIDGEKSKGASDSAETSRKNDRRKKRNNKKGKNKHGHNQDSVVVEIVSGKVEIGNEKQEVSGDAQEPTGQERAETKTDLTVKSELVLEPVDFDYIFAAVNGEPTVNKSTEKIGGVPKENEEVTQIGISDEYLIANMKTCVDNDRARVKDLLGKLDHVDASVLADWILNKHNNVAALFKNDPETVNPIGKAQTNANDLGNCDNGNEISHKKDTHHGRELRSYDSLAMFSPCQTTLDKADEESRVNTVSGAFGKVKTGKKSQNRNKSNKENTNILNTPPKTRKAYSENRDITPVRNSRQRDDNRKGNVAISNGFEDGSNLNQSTTDDRSFLQQRSKRLPARDLVVYDEIDMFSPSANNLDEYEIDYTYVEQYPNCKEDKNNRRGSSSQDSLHHNDSLDIKLRKKIKPGNRLQRKKSQRQSSNMDLSRMETSGGDNDSSRNTSSTLVTNEDSETPISNGNNSGIAADQKELRQDSDKVEQGQSQRKGSNDDTDFQISWEKNVPDRKAQKSYKKNASNAVRISRKDPQTNGKPKTSRNAHIPQNKIAAEDGIEGATYNDLGKAYEANFSKLELSQYNDEEYVFLPESSDESSYTTTDNDTLDEEESDDDEYVESEDDDLNENEAGEHFDYSESSMASSGIELKCAKLLDEDEESCTDEENSHEEGSTDSSDSFQLHHEHFILMKQMIRDGTLCVNSDNDISSSRIKSQKSTNSRSKHLKKGGNVVPKIGHKGANSLSKDLHKGGAHGGKSQFSHGSSASLNFRDWMTEMELYNVSTNVNVSDDEDLDESYNIIKTPTPLKNLNPNVPGNSNRAGGKPLKNQLLRRALMNKQNQLNAAWTQEEIDDSGVLPLDYQQQQPFQSNFSNSFNFDMDFSNMPAAQRMRGSRHANRAPMGNLPSPPKGRNDYGPYEYTTDVPEQYLSNDLTKHHHSSKRCHAPLHELMYTSSPRRSRQHCIPSDHCGHSGKHSSDFARLNHSSLPGHSHGHYSHGGFNGTFRGPTGGFNGVVGGPMIGKYLRSASQFKDQQLSCSQLEFDLRQKLQSRKQNIRNSTSKPRKARNDTVLTNETYEVFNDSNEIDNGQEDYVESNDFDDSNNAFDSESTMVTRSEVEEEASSDEDDVDSGESNASQNQVAKKGTQKRTQTKSAEAGSPTGQSNGSFQSTQSGNSGEGSSYKSISLEGYSIIDEPGSVDISWQTCISRVDQTGQADEDVNRRNSHENEDRRRDKETSKKRSEKPISQAAQDLTRKVENRKVGVGGGGKKNKNTNKVFNPYEAPMPGAWHSVRVDETGANFGEVVDEKRNRGGAKGRCTDPELFIDDNQMDRKYRDPLPRGRLEVRQTRGGVQGGSNVAPNGGLHRGYSGSETGSLAHRSKAVKSGPLFNTMPNDSMLANNGTFMRNDRFMSGDFEGLPIGAYGRERANRGNPRAKEEARRAYLEDRVNTRRYPKKAQRGEYAREVSICDHGLQVRYEPQVSGQPIRSRRYDPQQHYHGKQEGLIYDGNVKLNQDGDESLNQAEYQDLNYTYEHLYSSGCEDYELEDQESSGDNNDENGLVNDEESCPYENVLRAHPAYYPGQNLTAMRRRLNRQAEWIETYQAQMRLYMNVARNIASSGAYEF
uniref:Probable ATP-dependent RNA helicase DDX20 n=1 Tax=Cacopsylla melanoneura TaxID=428564 RepID=A0A8D9EI54_9HEMI